MLKEVWVFVLLLLLLVALLVKAEIIQRLLNLCYSNFVGQVTSQFINICLVTNPSELSFEHMAVWWLPGFCQGEFCKISIWGSSHTQMRGTLLELIIACQVWGLIRSNPRASNFMLKCLSWSGCGSLLRPSNPMPFVLCWQWWTLCLDSLVWNPLCNHKHVAIVKAIHSLGLRIENNLDLQLQASSFLWRLPFFLKRKMTFQPCDIGQCQ